jgi:Tol biopolymer transport system component
MIAAWERRTLVRMGGLRGLVVLLIAVAALGAATAQAAPSRYLTAPFTLTTHHATFGQAPVFMPGGKLVVAGKDFRDGNGTQVYIAKLDGSQRRCLTCAMKAPNNVPAVRPQGDWILFHSWNGHRLTVGSPGYGGIGSELWVMRPDGSRKTQLTGLDAARGAGEGEDDYHAYWSPDGKRLVWAHLNWNFVNNGGTGYWDIAVADFVDDGVHPPQLARRRVVRPANGNWYETHWWAPDGSGFLYTETAGNAMNTELYFCRLSARGCTVKHLTNFEPGWDEQAIFTPDMKAVIFMSSRDHPGFLNSFSQLTQAAGLPTSLDYLLVLPIFEAGFLQPVAQEATDLYLLDLSTRAVRRLTTEGDDGWIIPEFTWDPKNRYLFWTEQRIIDRLRVPLPLDPAKQLQRLAAYLADPALPPVGDNNIALIPLEARTRVMRFRRAR